jgi:predicted RNase H-like HicB family nuclease
MSLEHFGYCVTWSPEDGEYVGLCAEFPSLAWLAPTPDVALSGIRQLVDETVVDMRASDETVPEPMAEKRRIEALGRSVEVDKT